MAFKLYHNKAIIRKVKNYIYLAATHTKDPTVEAVRS